MTNPTIGDQKVTSNHLVHVHHVRIHPDLLELQAPSGVVARQQQDVLLDGPPHRCWTKMVQGFTTTQNETHTESFKHVQTLNMEKKQANDKQHEQT